MAKICKIIFTVGVDKEAIEEQLALSIVSAECAFGSPRVRLYANYSASDDKAAIDISSDIGEFIAQVFIGLVIKEYGEESFKVERVAAKDSD